MLGGSYCLGAVHLCYLVTLGIGVSTLGIGATTPGMCVACHAAWVARTLLQLALAFAASFFAIAILVKSSLTFCYASAVFVCCRYDSLERDC